MEFLWLNKGFVEMRKPKRDFLRSRFKLCQMCSPRLRAAQTDCRQQVAVTIRERKRGAKTAPKNEQTKTRGVWR